MKRNGPTKATYTLCIDLTDSTRIAKNWTDEQQAAFNLSLVKQMRPYYEHFSCGDELLKFTGDGWLLIVPDETRLRELVVLGLAIVKRFRGDMKRLLAPTSARSVIVPAVRAAICGGPDRPVILPDGTGDFAGDSVRWAVRTMHNRAIGKLLVNGAVHDLIHREFSLERHKNFRRAGKGAQAPDALYEVTAVRASSRAKRASTERATVSLQSVIRSGPGVVVPSIGKIDFHFVWGACDGTVRNPRKVRIIATSSPWAPPKIVSSFLWRDTYERSWQKYFENPKGPGYYFRPLLRVCDCVTRNDELVITVQPTHYTLFAATNLQLENGAYGRLLQAWVGSDDIIAFQPFLASSLNVIATIVTRDNHVVVAQRSWRPVEKPQRLQASVGGHVEWGVDPAKPPPADQHLREFLRESEDELGLTISSRKVAYFGFGYNGVTGEPDILATITVPETAAKVRRLFQHRLDKEELESVDTFDMNDRNRVAALISLLRMRSRWSQPSDRAALAATLLYHSCVPM